MIQIPPSVRVFALARPVRFTTEIDCLVRIVRDEIRANPFTGNIFCFFNARRDRVKLLVWDRNGFWVFCKRLERGRFERLSGEGGPEITRGELVMLLQGIDTRTSRFRLHFARDVRISARGDDGRC